MPSKKEIPKSPRPTLPPAPDGVKLTRFKVENLMAIRGVVEADVDGRSMIKFVGKNGAGKSTLLRAISSQFGVLKPLIAVHHGEKSAYDEFHFSNGLVVQQYWQTAGPDAPEVAELHVWHERVPGDASTRTEYSDPATTMDLFMGTIALDPTRLERMSQNSAGLKELRQIVLGLAKMPKDVPDRLKKMDVQLLPGEDVFTALSRRKKELEDVRRETGRFEDRTRKAAGEMHIPAQYADAVELPADKLVDLKNRLSKRSAERAVTSQKLSAERLSVERVQGEITDLEARLRTARQSLADHEKAVRVFENAVKTGDDAEMPALKKALAAAGIGVATLMQGIEEVDHRLRNAAEHNGWVAKVQEKKRKLKEADEFKETYDGYTRQLKEIDDFKTWLAETAVLPVKGLGFSEDGLTLPDPETGRPVPQNQWCDAQKWPTWTRIAAAQNELKPPDERLMVMLLEGASTMDRDTLKLVVQSLPKYQFFASVVDEAAGPLRITDGDGKLLASVQKPMKARRGRS